MTETEFLKKTNEDYAAWCKTYYRPEVLDERGMVSLHGLWAWQEQERRIESLHQKLSATDHGSTHQDKSAIFKSLGLVPWDNKPPACTDTVWIEPGRVATKESQGSKP